jgi:hypothetical protein
MARVHLLSVAPTESPKWAYAHDDLQRMQYSAQRDKFGIHQMTEDPAVADVILFVENCTPIQHAFEVRTHPVYRAHQSRCFLFSRNDLPVAFLPGIYASIPQHWYDPSRVRSGFYLDVFDHDFLPDGDISPRDVLYSFVGHRANHVLREQIFGLQHENQCLIDTSSFWPYGELSSETRTMLEEQYVDVARRSRFVLCPRGLGASSIRLFEMMRMGRAPVILSDAWVPPEGPAWDTFSIRVPERDLGRLPALLEARASEAVAMGQRAREAWEQWFGPEAAFHRTTEWLLDLQRTRTSSYQTARRIAPQLLDPTCLRSFLRTSAGYLPSLQFPALA